MRIAQLAPLAEAVPPSHYGGTERVIATLIDQLVRRGHEVTLFASGDSDTPAALVPVVPRALRQAELTNGVPAALLAATLACERAADFDVIHSHLDLLGLPFGRTTRTPLLHTLHGRLDLPEMQPLLRHYTDAALVAISENQRRLVPDWPWAGTVYNGIDVASYTFHHRPGQYLAFLGRIAPEKGVEDAIAIARRAGMPLKVAAKVDPVDRDYYEAVVRPLMQGPGVEYIGEITEAEKSAFLGPALALLFPVHWPEPFGLVMVEALACGTPVRARRCGSVQEVLEDGVTGFIGDSNEELALACERVAGLDRRACRQRVEAHFSADHMADGYEALYRTLVTAQVPVGVGTAPGRSVSVLSVPPNGHHGAGTATDA